MERVVFKKAYCLAESLDVCVNLVYMFDHGGMNEVLDRHVSILVRNDKEFSKKLRDLLKDTQKRLQKEFDEL